MTTTTIADLPNFNTDYDIGRKVTSFIIFIGFIIVIISIGTLFMITNFIPDPSRMVLGITIASGLLGALVGFLVVAYGQFIRATLDTADYNKQLLRMAVTKLQSI